MRELSLRKLYYLVRQGHGEAWGIDNNTAKAECRRKDSEAGNTFFMVLTVK